VSTVEQAARRLVAQRPTHPRHRVISLYLDLDPERFATAPARASQIRSLIDGAAREVDGMGDLDHDELIALREDLDRVRDYLLSRGAGGPPFKGARALAVFCSSRDELFETVQLARSVPGRVVIEHSPYVEPMVAALGQRRWCVLLVSRRDARMFTGPAGALEERRSFHDDVHGQHDQGGWSQPRYERSVEKEVDDHLRRVAELLDRSWRRDRFDRLALGGPPEIVPRLDGMLSEEVRGCLADGRVEVDVSSANGDQVQKALADLVEEDETRLEREALDRLHAGVGGGGRGAGGVADTVRALAERRVQTLLLAPDFDGRGQRCPVCGLLAVDSDGQCPADGTALQEVEHLREAVVEAALAQDAEVMVVRHHPDLGPFQGIGAVLRF
jgi:peptide chain release factor subunit 1